VKQERLRQRRKGQKHGWPFSFLLLNEGKGIAWKGEEPGKQIDESKEFDIEQLLKVVLDEKEESRETEAVELDDIRKLGIVTLGSLLNNTRESHHFGALSKVGISVISRPMRRGSFRLPDRKSILTDGEITSRMSFSSSTANTPKLFRVF